MNVDIVKFIQRNRDSFNKIIDLLPMPLFVKDVDGVYIACNKSYEEFFLLPRERLIGKNAYDIWPKEHAEVFSAKDRELFDRGGLQVYETEVRPVDGTTRHVQFSKHVFHAAGGAVAGFFGVVFDITERKAAETALQDSRGTLETVLSAAQDAVVVIDDGGRITLWNAAATRMFGYSAGEARDKDPHFLIAPDRFRADYLSGFEHFRTSGAGSAIGRTLELVARRKDGGEFPIELSLSAVKLKGRWHAVGILRDITARKIMADELEAYRAGLEQLVQSRTAEVAAAMQEQEALFETATSGMALIKDRVVIRANQKLHEIFGWPAGEMIGKPTAIWYADEKANAAGGEPVYRPIWRGEPSRREQELMRRDGTLFWARLSGRAVDLVDRGRARSGSSTTSPPSATWSRPCAAPGRWPRTRPMPRRISWPI